MLTNLQLNIAKQVRCPICGSWEIICEPERVQVKEKLQEGEIDIVFNCTACDSHLGITYSVTVKSGRR